MMKMASVMGNEFTIAMLTSLAERLNLDLTHLSHVFDRPKEIV